MPSRTAAQRGATSQPVRWAAATNLIRAHRDELLQASPGKLDHMVIEVVGSLFDQILSDARVPPQMAREIARLQLPVLRVALTDPSFFSSRRHPVRRFINRIASLANAFDDFDSGPAKDLLGRVSALVNEIVEGDFDQIDALRRQARSSSSSFIAEQTHAEFESSPAAATLRRPRSSSGELAAALQPAAARRARARSRCRPILQDSCAGSGARRSCGVAARRRRSADPARLSAIAAPPDLVRSVQPKRSPEQRKDFLTGLPALMADARRRHEVLIGLAAGSAGRVLRQADAEHAGSLKATPRSELDHNMMVRQLDAAARVPLARRRRSGHGADPAAGSESFEPRFSAREAQRLGLVDEAQVDWSIPTSPSSTSEGANKSSTAGDAVRPAKAPIELDLDLGDPPGAARGRACRGRRNAAFPTLTLFAEDAPKIAPPARSHRLPLPNPKSRPRARSLRHHLQIGASYRLQLKEQWEKVRLTLHEPESHLLPLHARLGRSRHDLDDDSHAASACAKRIA